MQSKMALMTIGHVLGLADVAIESYHFQEDGTLIIRVYSCWEIAVCPDCGTISQDPNGYGEPHLIRDLSIFGQPCYLELRGHRFACEECRDTFTERLKWVGPQAALHPALRRARLQPVPEMRPHSGCGTGRTHLR
jgi:transposase